MAIAIGFMYLCCLALVPLVGIAVWWLSETDRMQAQGANSSADAMLATVSEIRDTTQSPTQSGNATQQSA
jgi:hypothetical protein